MPWPTSKVSPQARAEPSADSTHTDQENVYTSSQLITASSSSSSSSPPPVSNSQPMAPTGAPQLPAPAPGHNGQPPPQHAPQSADQPRSRPTSVSPSSANAPYMPNTIVRGSPSRRSGSSATSIATDTSVIARLPTHAIGTTIVNGLSSRRRSSIRSAPTESLEDVPEGCVLSHTRGESQLHTILVTQASITPRPAGLGAVAEAKGFSTPQKSPPVIRPKLGSNLSHQSSVSSLFDGSESGWVNHDPAMMELPLSSRLHESSGSSVLASNRGHEHLSQSEGVVYSMGAGPVGAPDDGQAGQGSSAARGIVKLCGHEMEIPWLRESYLPRTSLRDFHWQQERVLVLATTIIMLMLILIRLTNLTTEGDEPLMAVSFGVLFTFTLVPLTLALPCVVDQSRYGLLMRMWAVAACYFTCLIQTATSNQAFWILLPLPIPLFVLSPRYAGVAIVVIYVVSLGVLVGADIERDGDSLVRYALALTGCTIIFGIHTFMLMWRNREAVIWEKLYGVVLNGTFEGIVLLDDRLLIRRYNLIMLQMFGSSTLLDGQPLENIIAPHDRARLLAALEAAASSRMLIEVEAQAGPGAPSFPVEVSIMRISGFVICSLRNMIHRKEIENMLLEAKESELIAKESLIQEARRQAQMKSSFVSTVTHELRTPLNAVIGMSQILSSMRLNAEQANCAEVIRTASESLLDLVNDILDNEKIDADAFEFEERHCDLNGIVWSSLSIVAPKAFEKSVEIGYRAAPDLPPAVTGDPSRYKQVLLNLLSNAVKFTPGGGHVIVTVSATRLADSDDIVVETRVIDSGIGIAPEEMSRLFVPFGQAAVSTQREYGGTGLGLSISRKLAQRMGGDIAVKSKKNRGTTFSFTATFGSVIAPGSSLMRDELRLAVPGNVVVVYRNKRIRSIIRRQMEDWNIEVQMAGTLDDVKPKPGTVACLILEAEYIKNSAIGSMLAENFPTVVITIPGAEHELLTSLSKTAKALTAVNKPLSWEQLKRAMIDSTTIFAHATRPQVPGTSAPAPAMIRSADGPISPRATSSVSGRNVDQSGNEGDGAKFDGVRSSSAVGNAITSHPPNGLATSSSGTMSGRNISFLGGAAAMAASAMASLVEQPYENSNSSGRLVRSTGSGTAAGSSDYGGGGGSGVTSVGGGGSGDGLASPRSTASNAPSRQLPVVDADAVKKAMRIAVVDDEPLSARVSGQLVKAVGYVNVDVFTKGADLVEKHSADPYHIIFLDLHMPGMDGYETATRILATDVPKERTPALLALSGTSVAEEMTRAINVGFLEVVGKPLRLDTLAQVLDRVSSSLRLTVVPLSRRASLVAGTPSSPPPPSSASKPPAARASSVSSLRSYQSGVSGEDANDAPVRSIMALTMDTKGDTFVDEARSLFSAPDSVPAGPPPVILVVDGNTVHATSICTMLRRFRLDAQSISSGEAVIEKWRSYRKGTVKIILMSLILPDTDGSAVTSQIREIEYALNLPPVPIIIMGTKTQSPLFRRCEAAGATECVTKPIHRAHLVQKLRQYIVLVRERSMSSDLLGPGERHNHSFTSQSNTSGWISIPASHASSFVHNAAPVSDDVQAEILNKLHPPEEILSSHSNSSSSEVTPLGSSVTVGSTHSRSCTGASSVSFDCNCTNPDLANFVNASRRASVVKPPARSPSGNSLAPPAQGKPKAKSPAKSPAKPKRNGKSQAASSTSIESSKTKSTSKSKTKSKTKSTSKSTRKSKSKVSKSQSKSIDASKE
ncbi:sensor protein [Thecamonas trahens ATCC 50062]|uniref:Sensor protein n=1 Tax=Thecamonas trahens ATCC 50062 TaxID=461836 RepID=A0A0L0DMQ2_THETB|nr:sensor protein [Thecamonas trahens ATCC 50062]KNC53572.1 sensor protein [Thecamonas trahens ATCC 50062]|eukprot:XP_013761889.1 sensor protein [Thecamonas trahens ATCC 50062]